MTYHGVEPFSEPETQAIRDLVGDVRDGTASKNNWADHFDGGISYHSYSQLILYPYGYADVKTKDHELLKTVAERMSKIIEDETGKEYRAIQSSELYPAAGTTDDWFYEATGGSSFFTFELPPKGNDPAGFQLSKEEIEETVRENIPAALYYIEYLATKNVDIDLDSNKNGINDYYEDDDSEKEDLDNQPVENDDKDAVTDDDSTSEKETVDIDNNSGDDENNDKDEPTSDASSDSQDQESENKPTLSRGSDGCSISTI